MTGSGYHLVLVVLAPLVLCVSGAIASSLWRRWWVLGACLLPAWVLAALQYGLFELRDELSGPVRALCRLDDLSLAWAICALPLSAAAAWRVSRRGLVAWTPARFGAFQAWVAALGSLAFPFSVPLALVGFAALLRLRRTAACATCS